MSPEIINAYQAFETIDETGELGQAIGWFLEEKDAEEAIRKRAGDSDGHIIDILVVNVGGMFYELAQEEPIILDQEFEEKRKLREQALAKLSKEEIEALGIG